MIKEACVESFEKSLEAQNNGANRIELCENLAVGGTTPSYGTVKVCLEKLNIPIFPMIRARGGNFVYSKDEIEIMKEDIRIFKELGVKGVVFGFLTSDNKIDLELTKELVELAAPMEVTFHKAIDETNVLESVNVLNRYDKITNILTAGGINNISDNTNNIKAMIENSKANILLGGGLNFDNVKRIKELTQATDFHFGTAVRIDKSPFGEIDTNKLSQLVKLLEV